MLNVVAKNNHLADIRSAGLRTIMNILEQKMLKNHQFLMLSVAAVILVSGCTLIDRRFENPADRNHPAMQVFLAYNKAVRQAESFAEIYRDFYPESQWELIEGTMGWARLAYSASFKGLKTGKCNELSLLRRGPQRAEILCKGVYRIPNNLMQGKEFGMEIKVIALKSGDRWYLGRSGMKHETGLGNYAAFGIKF
ncbi:MAG: hypothetical protein KJP25_12900 [Gammaproteobacteria bacterium]|nr:hypothetical protein [Gammaproteobacteria bacterium]